ncbi:hypothetical protein CLAIMM_13744 [Cladophialophora immunda]|nr:hypothetical protein CLAIMM_13744 [Cladophialophora immunda]
MEFLVINRDFLDNDSPRRFVFNHANDSVYEHGYHHDDHNNHDHCSYNHDDDDNLTVYNYDDNNHYPNNYNHHYHDHHYYHNDDDNNNYYYYYYNHHHNHAHRDPNWLGTTYDGEYVSEVNINNVERLDFDSSEGDAIDFTFNDDCNLVTTADGNIAYVTTTTELTEVFMFPPGTANYDALVCSVTAANTLDCAIGVRDFATCPADGNPVSSKTVRRRGARASRSASCMCHRSNK